MSKQRIHFFLNNPPSSPTPPFLKNISTPPLLPNQRNLTPAPLLYKGERGGSNYVRFPSDISLLNALFKIKAFVIDFYIFHQKKTLKKYEKCFFWDIQTFVLPGLVMNKMLSCCELHVKIYIRSNGMQLLCIRHGDKNRN